MVTVFIPPVLRSMTNGTSSVTLSAATVRDVVDGLDVQFPGLRARLCDDDQLRPGLSVAIGSRIYGRSLLERIPEGAEVHFLPAVAGG